ncbi:hypothetical protein Tco_0566739 [Tanacetum coccineum]
MILVNLEEKVYSYVIRLNFYAFEDSMDYEALLAGLAAFAGKGMKEIIDATAPFHRFQITYLLKALKPRTEALTGLTSIRLELLNQEVSVGVKTRPSMEAQGKSSEKARNVAKKATTGKPNPTWEDHSPLNLRRLDQPYYSPKGKLFDLELVASARWITTHLQLVCPKLGVTPPKWVAAEYVRERYFMNTAAQDTREQPLHELAEKVILKNLDSNAHQLRQAAYPPEKYMPKSVNIKLIQRISLTGFPAQSVGSSNTDVLDSPCLLVLITGTSQSRQHGKSESDSYYLSD